MPKNLRENGRKARTKCFTRVKKKTVRKSDTRDKPAEETIVHDAQAAAKDAAFILEPVHCAVASPSHGNSPPQARAYTPLDQLLSDRPLTEQPCRPINFLSSPDNDLTQSHPGELNLKGRNTLSNYQSAEVALQATQTKLDEPKASASSLLEDESLVLPLKAQPSSPIDFCSFADNDSAASQPREVLCEEIHTSLNSQSAEVPLEVTHTQLREEINTSSDIHVQTASARQSADVVPFEVAEIYIVLETSEETSSEASCELQQGSEDENIPTQTTASTQTESTKLEEIKARIKHSLPPSWHCSEYQGSGDSGITLLKYSTGTCFLAQRHIYISEDGKVHLFVHGKFLRLNHEIWGQLPRRVSLASHSVDDSCLYVLGVAELVHSYDICPGCPRTEEQYMARKMGASFSPNTFKEKRYSTTHRSQDCGLLVRPFKTTSACSGCTTLRRNIRKRLKRKEIKERKAIEEKC